MKRTLLLPLIGLLLCSTPALAQQAAETILAQAGQGHYVVYFAFDQAALDDAARATISEAAEEFQRTGSANIQVAGHTDTSGSSAYNQALSERRELAVTDELIRLGVPASAINGEAYGETQPVVQTGDGVKEERNRRVDITLAQPAPAPEPEPAPAPAPVAEEPPPPPVEERGLFSAGLFYGYNLEDQNGHDSQLGGINFGVDYAVIPWLSVGLEQAGFYHFDTENDGFGGRTAGSLDFRLAREDFVPHIGGNIGYLYGSGFDDEFFAGPEIGLSYGMFLAKVAYDIPFNRGLDEGIIASTLGVGFSF